MSLRNLEARREYNKAYYVLNREKAIANRRKYYLENRDVCLASVKAYKHKYRHKYLEYWRERARLKAKGPDRTLADLKSQIIYSLRDRARRRKIEFDITVADLEIPEFCPVFGFRLESGRRVMRHNSPSVDRIDPKKGYVRGNVQVISLLANAMKRDASKEQLIAFAHWILRTEE